MTEWFCFTWIQMKDLSEAYFDESKRKDQHYVPTLEEHLHVSLLEQTREHVASTVQCYMKEYGTNVYVACKKLQGLADDAWKDINEECLNPTAFPIALLERIVNFSRMIEHIYKYIDGYTNSSRKMKEYISLILVHPIPI
uniref:Terpene synthase metal-binding domain-containing protein n=1 Tax=Musa acuminata subsp. malaccensis TaxID=214687 RepID=A0A804JX72_MUSAM